MRSSRTRITFSKPSSCLLYCDVLVRNKCNLNNISHKDQGIVTIRITCMLIKCLLVVVGFSWPIHVHVSGSPCDQRDTLIRQDDCSLWVSSPCELLPWGAHRLNPGLLTSVLWPAELLGSVCVLDLSVEDRKYTALLDMASGRTTAGFQNSSVCY